MQSLFRYLTIDTNPDLAYDFRNKADADESFLSEQLFGAAALAHAAYSLFLGYFHGGSIHIAQGEPVLLPWAAEREGLLTEKLISRNAEALHHTYRHAKYFISETASTADVFIFNGSISKISRQTIEMLAVATLVYADRCATCLFADDPLAAVAWSKAAYEHFGEATSRATNLLFELGDQFVIGSNLRPVTPDD